MRGVFLDISAQFEVDSACVKWERGEHVWRTVELILAHDPEVGTPSSESGATRSFTWEGAYSARLPTVTVIYTFNKTDVTVQATRWSDAVGARYGRA